MGCFDPSVPDVGKAYKQGISATAEGAPYLASAQSALAPLYGAINAAGIKSALMGYSGGPTNVNWTTRGRGGKTVDRNLVINMPNSPGLLSMYENDIAPAIARTNSATASMSRGADIADLNRYSPELRMALRSANPEGAGLLDTLTNQAQSDLNMGAGLNPSEMRTVSQSVRGGQAARGMGMGPMDNFQEALKSLNYGRGLQDQRRGFASNVLGQNQSFYGDPSLAILGRSSGTGSAAQGFLGQASQMPGAPDLSRTAGDIGGSLFNARSAAEIAGSNNDAAMASGVMNMASSSMSSM